MVELTHFWLLLLRSGPTHSRTGLPTDTDVVETAIKQAATSAYGAARPEFVLQMVAAGISEVKGIAAGMIASFVRTSLPPDADGQVKRAAERLGLIGAAGELAREWGIVPWQQGEAIARCQSPASFHVPAINFQRA